MIPKPTIIFLSHAEACPKVQNPHPKPLNHHLPNPNSTTIPKSLIFLLPSTVAQTLPSADTPNPSADTPKPYRHPQTPCPKPSSSWPQTPHRCPSTTDTPATPPNPTAIPKCPCRQCPTNVLPQPMPSLPSTTDALIADALPPAADAPCSPPQPPHHVCPLHRIRHPIFPTGSPRRTPLLLTFARWIFPGSLPQTSHRISTSCRPTTPSRIPPDSSKTPDPS